MVFVLQMKFCFFTRILFLMELVRNLFLTDIGFCQPIIIHAFNRNFNFYLLIFSRGAKCLSNELILLKKDSVE